MRIYIPATSADLFRERILPRTVHGVTAALRSAMPGEDDEVLESVAMLAAADDSLRILQALAAGRETLNPLRVVIAADVADAAVRQATDPDELPTALSVTGVDWDRVRSIHVDSDEAVPDILEALSGDDAAFERVADEDLMWFDADEREDLQAYFS